MADIKKVNVGGLDYNVKDDTARTNATTALSHEAYVENGNTASQAYAIIGTPINWKGTLCHTKTAVAKGATWAIGTNLTAVANLGKMISSIKTYVGGDGKLHFTDGTGADTVLPFSGTAEATLLWTNPLWSNGYHTETNPNNYCMPSFTVPNLSKYNHIAIYASNGYYSSPSDYAPFIFDIRGGVIAAPSSSGVYTRTISISGDTITVGSNSDGWTCVPTMVWGL